MSEKKETTPEAKPRPGYEKVNALASRIAKAEEGKSEAKIGDIRQLLGLIADEVIKDPSTVYALAQYGRERQKEKKK